MNRRSDGGLESLLEALARRRISRRDAFRYAGAGGLAAFLAACGIEGATTSPTTPAPTSPGATTTPSPTPSPLPPQAGVLNVANWPLYIDDKRGREGSVLAKFEEATGIDITYKEDISDNDEWFGTDLRQQLSAGQSTGWDVITMTDWMIAKLIRLGWLQPLHHDVLPNAVQNLDDKFRDPYFDPGRQYSFPWAAGITGLGYNRVLAGREITSINDLFDPAFKGRVGMFSEMRDTINFSLFLDGIRPDDATFDDVERAVDRLHRQRDQGIVRAYYGNDYTDPLLNGDLIVTMAWSGDVNYLALDNPDLDFVIPVEGGNRWTDNMAIPILTEHPADAHEWINFVYDPEIAAQITETVWYESPVDAETIRALIRDHASEDQSLLAVSESELVWPSRSVLQNTFGYKILSEGEEQAWHELFDPLLEG